MYGVIFVPHSGDLKILSEQIEGRTRFFHIINAGHKEKCHFLTLLTLLRRNLRIDPNIANINANVGIPAKFMQ